MHTIKLWRHRGETSLFVWACTLSIDAIIEVGPVYVWGGRHTNKAIIEAGSVYVWEGIHTNKAIIEVRPVYAWGGMHTNKAIIKVGPVYVWGAMHIPSMLTNLHHTCLPMMTSFRPLSVSYGCSSIIYCFSALHTAPRPLSHYFNKTCCFCLNISFNGGTLPFSFCLGMVKSQFHILNKTYDKWWCT